jgi:hypothetical protein
MQQRRLRLGDVLDDYCPRERRITNHVVVAMVDDEVKQTRCSTCDAEHEYKAARVPPPRRRKAAAGLADVAEGLARPRPVPPAPDEERPGDALVEEPAAVDEEPAATAAGSSPPAALASDPQPPEGVAQDDREREDEPRDDWGHRPLIRATLPRQEGQTPERKPADFTLRNGRFDHNRAQRHRGARSARQGQSHGPSRFGSTPGGQNRPHGGPSRHSGQGGRPGPSQAQRGGRPPGQGRGPGGRKRGR